MILTRSQRINNTGMITREDVFGPQWTTMTPTEDDEREWQTLRLEYQALIVVGNMYDVLVARAKELLRGRPASPFQEWQMKWMGDVSAYGREHPIPIDRDSTLSDPLASLYDVATAIQLLILSRSEDVERGLIPPEGEIRQMYVVGLIGECKKLFGVARMRGETLLAEARIKSDPAPHNCPTPSDSAKLSQLLDEVVGMKKEMKDGFSNGLTKQEFQQTNDAVMRRFDEMGNSTPTKDDWKKTDDAVMAGLDKKTRREQKARRRMKEMNESEGRTDPDLKTIHRAIDTELKAQVKRGEKENVTKAVRTVLSRPGCARTLDDLQTVRRLYYKQKKHGRRKKVRP